ncbi:MAG TPA: hypothetical protein VKT18_01545, partial [Acidimicrobiales bacterium]|nr:hypothetical protein [Acidimicrobiales bacterium]
RLKRTGNRLMEVVGGRAVHPVNVRVGGFYSAPTPATLGALGDELRRARDDALATVDWVAGFDFPDVERDYRFVALRSSDGYPIESGTVAVSDAGTLSLAEFASRAREEHVAHSTALHARLDGGAYLTGPLARFALNADQLPPLARQAALAAGLTAPCRNPFRSVVVRSVELAVACEEALRLVESYEPPDPPHVEPDWMAGTGYGATEAPRGMLLNVFELDAHGNILSARIMPPTAQNQESIEDDLRRLVADRLHLDDGTLTSLCERAVRNHDPCISCATHFLDVTVTRR